MQESLRIEREARHRLPGLLSELLGQRAPASHLTDSPDRPGPDLVLEESGRRWLFEVKTSSRPGIVAEAGHRLHELAARALRPGTEAVAVLVVPYMSPAGARTAREAGVNWLDLSGNASIDANGLRVLVLGRPNAFPAIGRPSSPFAPKSARVTRTLLLDHRRWWRQKDLAAATKLDDGQVSRVVRRLTEERLIATQGREVRPSDPGLLLEAWADDYRFERHDIVPGHLSGGGLEVARRLSELLETHEVRHAFTGLPAAWALDHFATFRLTTIYVDSDPRVVADLVGLRREERGANVQLVGPDDVGVLAGAAEHDGLICAAPVQVYLDLRNLPERALDAADHLWTRFWSDGGD